jgi:hypothetical protein
LWPTWLFRPSCLRLALLSLSSSRFLAYQLLLITELNRDLGHDGIDCYWRYINVSTTTLSSLRRLSAPILSLIAVPAAVAHHPPGPLTVLS